MAFGKKLINITVSHSTGQVGLSLFYDNDVPAEHVLLPLKVAIQVRDKLFRACDLAARGVEKPVGDDVGVSDHVSLKLN